MKDFQLVRGLDPLMDAEALRVLQLVNERWSTGVLFQFKEMVSGVLCESIHHSNYF